MGLTSRRMKEEPSENAIVRELQAGDLEGLLARLYDTPGVKATRSYVVLSTYLERPVQPATTSDWPAVVKD